MSVFVLDASVVLQWFIPEPRSAAARRWLETAHEFLAPDLLFPELGNAVWKKCQRGELNRDEASTLTNDIATIAIEEVSMRALLPDAQALALGAGITVYDATYLALAVRLETQVVTGDNRLLRTLRTHPSLSPHARPVEDLA